MRAKRLTEEQIVGILREGQQGDKTIGVVCRSHGICDHTFYRWRRKYGDMGLPEMHRLRELERENSQLKRLVAERDLEIDAMKALLAKKW